MVSYRLFNVRGPNPLDTLRVVFYDTYSFKTVSAVYCRDYYSSEIAAEQSEDSNSTFYTKAYDNIGTAGMTEWICPNLTDTTIKSTYGF